MLKVNSYSAKGTKLPSFNLPKEFEEKENMVLLAQGIRVYEDRLHPGHAKVKTRAQVERTKKKLYKQKGTGGARHGAKSAPIFVGGGVAHGPKGIKRELELPLAMKKKVLGVSLSLKVKEGKVAVVDGVSGFKKTKDAGKGIGKILSDSKSKHLTLVVSEQNAQARKVLGNIKQVKVIPFPSLNAHDVYFGGTVVFDKEIFVKKTKPVKIAKKETKK